MCVTNIYVDRYPDGKEVKFLQTTYCENGEPAADQPCQKLSTLENPTQNIQFGEPTTEYTLTADDRVFPHAPPREPLSSHPSAIMNPNDLWGSAAHSLDSPRSTPTLFGEPWALPPPQITISTTNSPMEYSPIREGVSPRYVQDFTDWVEQHPYTNTSNRVTRKLGHRQSKVTSDLAAASRRPRGPGSSKTSDESFKLVGRSSLDLDNTAREHPLYHNVTPKADGLYHCPFEDDPKANCTHKPAKLKWNYEYDPNFLSFLPCLYY
jgi:hypothetical protein